LFLTQTIFFYNCFLLLLKNSRFVAHRQSNGRSTEESWKEQIYPEKINICPNGIHAKPSDSRATQNQSGG